MADVYTKVNFDFDSLDWLISPREKLRLQAVALGLINLPPNQGYTFLHSHQEQEEVYIVVQGSGKIQLNDELVDLERGDLVRVSPSTKRALKANDKGIFVVCSGAVPSGYPKNENTRYLIDDGVPDYDAIPKWYEGDLEVRERNSKLKRRMLKSKNKKINNFRFYSF